MLDSLDWQSIFLNISKSSQTLKLYNIVSDLSAFSVLFVLFLDQLPGSEYIPAAPKWNLHDCVGLAPNFNL